MPEPPKRWTAEPGSRLAQLRQEAHRSLDVYWEFGWVTRGEAYALLAQRLGVPLENCHIGMFDEAECERAIEVCKSGLISGPAYGGKRWRRREELRARQNG